MESDLKVENIVARIKEYLNAHKIKLWLEPYYDNVAGIGLKEEEALQVKINIFHYLLHSTYWKELSQVTLWNS